MKILLANHDLSIYAGTETYVYTLAIELQRGGHEVVCWSPRLGAVAQRLVAAGVTVTADLAAAPDDVDVIHAHHRYESLLARTRYPSCPMVFVAHGVLPWQEQPAVAALDASRYVAVSEEVRDHLVERHRVPADQVVIVRNGIDLERFRSRTPISPEPRRALILSNYMPPRQRAQVRRVCRDLGITVREAGAGNVLWAVEDEIAQADLVFGLGRSALEAMASRRVVLVYDYNGGDGLVTPERFERLRQRNFSGRTHHRRFTDAELAAEIQAYGPAVAEEVHAFIERDHDVRAIARQLVELYQEARRRPARAPGGATAPYRALAAALEDAAALRAAAESAQGSLRDIHQSRSWRALTMYRGLRKGLRRLRHLDRGQARRPRAARILIVDDDPLLCRWLTEALTTEGHVAEAVDSGRAALARLREAPFDLVLSDLRMPDLDGIALYREIERTHPRMAERVIFVSGNTREPRYQRFLADLADRNLAKPFDLGQLARLVQARLGPTTE
jgi:CheY-like chemotaxis protein/glycosyltransferase involved in cell wall biosynthesis